MLAADATGQEGSELNVTGHSADHDTASMGTLSLSRNHLHGVGIPEQAESSENR